MQYWQRKFAAVGDGDPKVFDQPAVAVTQGLRDVNPRSSMGT